MGHSRLGLLLPQSIHKLLSPLASRIATASNHPQTAVATRVSDCYCLNPSTNCCHHSRLGLLLLQSIHKLLSPLASRIATASIHPQTVTTRVSDCYCLNPS